MFCRWRMHWLWLGCLAVMLFPAPVLADESIEQRRSVLERDFIEKVFALADKCDELNLAPQAEQTRAWIAPRKSGRLVYYVADDPIPATTTGASERIKQWQARLVAIRQEYATALYALAEEAAQDQQGELALRLAYEVVHENPEQSQAKRVLGLERRVMRSSKPRAEAREHPKFGWRGGRHWSVDTRHFRIESNQSAQACSELAAELERLHDVWLQLYFPLWGRNETISGRFGGIDVPLLDSKHFHVVLFNSREEYLKQLSKGQKHLAVSSGIYFDEQKMSIFFAGVDARISTRYHEVTHQLIQEYLQAPAGTAKENNVWLVEAAALFMESLVFENGAAMLGAYDADNLQFARFRARGGDFQMPLKELVALGREALQDRPDIRKIYSQTAGLGHFFLEGAAGRFRKPFLGSLLAVYQGRAAEDTLATACGVAYAELDKQYYDFLNVTDEMIAQTPPLPSIRGLSLRKTDVTDRGLARFSRCNQLQWLDLSLTKTGDEGFRSFPATKTLTTLFLEQTAISGKSLSHVAEYINLEELYLSGTAINDEDLSQLAVLKKLNTLDIAGCPVTDACLPVLAQLKQLQSLDTTGTKVSPAGLAKLKRSLPKLEHGEGSRQ